MLAAVLLNEDVTWCGTSDLSQSQPIWFVRLLHGLVVTTMSIFLFCLTSNYNKQSAGSIVSTFGRCNTSSNSFLLLCYLGVIFRKEINIAAHTFRIFQEKTCTPHSLQYNGVPHLRARSIEILLRYIAYPICLWHVSTWLRSASTTTFTFLIRSFLDGWMESQRKIISSFFRLFDFCWNNTIHFCCFIL